MKRSIKVADHDSGLGVIDFEIVSDMGSLWRLQKLLVVCNFEALCQIVVDQHGCFLLTYWLAAWPLDGRNLFVGFHILDSILRSQTFKFLTSQIPYSASRPRKEREEPPKPRHAT